MLGAYKLQPGKVRGKGSSKQPIKGSISPTPSPPQAAGKKPKKKKIRDQEDTNTKSQRHGCSPSAVEETDKHQNKSRKHQTLSTQLLEILSLGKNLEPAQDAAKGIHIESETNKLLSSASTISGPAHTDQDFSHHINESLRWDGILEDPAAEEERLHIYKLNRRKRYELYVQQQLPTEPCLTSKHFPLLQNKDPYTNRNQMLCKDSSSPYFQGNKDEEIMNAELNTKPAALPNISQEVV